MPHALPSSSVPVQMSTSGLVVGFTNHEGSTRQPHSEQNFCWRWRGLPHFWPVSMMEGHSISSKYSWSIVDCKIQDNLVSAKNINDLNKNIFWQTLVTCILKHYHQFLQLFELDISELRPGLAHWLSLAKDRRRCWGVVSHSGWIVANSWILGMWVGTFQSYTDGSRDSPKLGVLLSVQKMALYWKVLYCTAHCSVFDYDNCGNVKWS